MLDLEGLLGIDFKKWNVKRGRNPFNAGFRIKCGMTEK